MKNKFYVSAIYTSPPGTMGGNTKILIEIVNNLSDRFNFVIFTTESKTFQINLKNKSRIKIIPVNYPFKKFNYFNHYSEIKYITKIYQEYFSKNKINQNDYFFSPSDFAPDVMPVYNLRKQYKFNWLASLFLFIPNPLENLINQYKFPFLKYIIYFAYQRYIFSKILQKADLFLITNNYDRKYFPKKFKEKIFAIYGGVNLEEIEKAKKEFNGRKEYDAVFCSRLHPQKGISQLLDVWGMVIKEIPNAKLAIIGNGEKKYEGYLREKAKDLEIQKNLKWFGYVNGADKYKIYLQSRVFLHGTIYDNNGMVAAEALCTGLPVIMYDLLQLKNVYTLGCIKVEIGNKKKYAKAIIDSLKEKNKRLDLKLQNELIEYWDWKKRLEIFLDYLKKNKDYA